MNEPEYHQTFFDLFTFADVEHQASSFCIVYNGCKMQKDIYDLSNPKTPILSKGARLEQVVFSLTKQTFSFVDSYVKVMDEEFCGFRPNKEVVITQKVLAPFLHYNDNGYSAIHVRCRTMV